MLFHISPQLALFLSVMTSLNARMGTAPECSDYDAGNGIRITATCYYNGTIEYQADRVWQSVDRVRIQYNCTGSGSQTGVSKEFTNTGGRFERGVWDIEDWNYDDSTCYFDGCYDEDTPPFSTYSISSVACTVLTPSPSTVQLTPTSFTSHPSASTTLGSITTTNPAAVSTPIPLATPIPTSFSPVSVPSSPNTIYVVGVPTTSLAGIMLLLISIMIIIFVVTRFQKQKTFSIHKNYYSQRIYGDNFDKVNDDIVDVSQATRMVLTNSMESITNQLSDIIKCKDEGKSLVTSTEDVLSEYDTSLSSDRFSDTKSEKLSQTLSPGTSSYYVMPDGQRYSGAGEEFQPGDDNGEVPALDSSFDEVFRTNTANEEYRHADFNEDSKSDLDLPLQIDFDTSEIVGDQHNTRFRQFSPDYIPKDSGFSATSYPPVS